MVRGWFMLDSWLLFPRPVRIPFLTLIGSGVGGSRNIAPFLALTPRISSHSILELLTYTPEKGQLRPRVCSTAAGKTAIFSILVLYTADIHSSSSCRRYLLSTPVYSTRFVSSLLLPPPSLAAVLYITRILLYLHLNLHILPLLFSRGDLCFVCMNHTDPAQHCISQKEALGCLANTALVDLHTTPLHFRRTAQAH